MQGSELNTTDCPLILGQQSGFEMTVVKPKPTSPHPTNHSTPNNGLTNQRNQNWQLRWQGGEVALEN